MWWILIPAVLVIFIIVLVVRAAMFKPLEQKEYEVMNFDIDEEGIVSRFSQMIQHKTISHFDMDNMDMEEFESFEKFLEKTYPKIHEHCEKNKVGPTGLLFKWKGQQSSSPTVLMSHYDVVPVEEEKWEKPPFSGIVENNEIWGRGTLDTKGTMAGVLEAAEQLLQSGYIPKQDIYLSFSGDEEIAGPSCPAIVDFLHERNVVPALVLDEGGAVVQGVFPGMSSRCALIGTGEKGITDIRMSIAAKGGHASSPKLPSSIGQLSKAVVDIEKKPFAYQLTPPVLQMFDTLGRHSSFGYKILFANLWCFSPLLDLFTRIVGGELNALMRTTVAFTMAKGSDAANVLPPKAEFTANLRLMGKDTYDSAIEHLAKIVNNDNIEWQTLHGSNATAYSDTNCEAWDNVKNAINQTWPDAVISPYLMFAASDSRRFNKITDKIYKFSPLELSKEQRSLIHAHNERIPVDSLHDLVRFYLRLISLV